MTLAEGQRDGDSGYDDRENAKGAKANLRRSTSIVTPRDLLRPGPRNRSVMSDLTPETRLSFLPIIRRSSMASSVASSLKSGSLCSSSTGFSSPMSGPSTGFSSPAKMAHLPRVLLREMQPGLFDVQDELAFNRSVRLPLLDTSPTDCRLNLVAQRLQEGTTAQQEPGASAKATESDRETRQTRDDRENQTKRKRRKNRKRSEQRRKEPEVD